MNKIIELLPYHRTAIKSVGRAIEVQSLLIKAVVKHDVKATLHGDDQLMQRFVSMSTTLYSTSYK
jgi:predicted DNA-binding ArsR family transcriptional regulator